jgi:hypothetical protein
MDLNEYNSVMSNVGALNNQIVNSASAAEAAKNKITETIGDVITGEGIKEFIGKAVSPMASAALKKIGVGAKDLEDLKGGNISKLLARRLQEKLGGKTPEQFLQEKAQAAKDALQKKANNLTDPIRNRGNQDVENRADAEPGKSVEEPPSNLVNDEDIDNEAQGALDDLKSALKAPAAADAAEEGGEDLASSLDNPFSFKSFIKKNVDGYDDATDDIFEGARTELKSLSDLDFSAPTGNISLSGGPTLAPSSTANLGNIPEAGPSNIPEGSRLVDPEIDDEFSLQTPSQLSGSLQNVFVTRPPEDQQTGTQPATNENTSGSNAPLQNDEGGNIADLANKDTGASSSSGDGSLANSTARTTAATDEDEGVENLAKKLLTTSAETDEIPVIGEAIGPLLAVGAGLAAIFDANEHHAKPATINPSFQFL